MPNVRTPILGPDDKVVQSQLPAHLTTAAITEAAQDAVAAMLAAGTGVTLSYNDAGNALTITSTGGTGGGLDAEAVRDAIGVAIIGAGLITVTVNDAADTITISTTATANATDAALRDRTTHTGTQPAASISDLTETVQDMVGAMILAGSNITKSYDDASGTVTLSASGTGAGGVDAEAVRDTMAAALVAGSNITITNDDASDTITVSTTATVNASDADLRNRANHTGTQPISTISNFGEGVDDRVAALIRAGAGITLAYDDVGNALTITAADASPEAIRDAVGLALVGTGGVVITPNDDTDTITITLDSVPISAVSGLQTALDNKVTSVNGATGAVQLNADDVSAAPIGHTHTASEISDLPQGTNGLNGVTAIPPIGTTSISVGAGDPLWWNDAGRSLTIVAVRLLVSVAGTGTTTVDVNVGGTTIFTNQANRPSITSGNTTGVSGTVGTGVINPGQAISVDIDAAGSYAAGAVLTVLITAV